LRLNNDFYREVKMKKFIKQFAVVALSVLAMESVTHACTDFRITAKDGTILIARSMEFALDLKSNLRTSPRNRQFTYMTNDQKPAMNWNAKYGYVYVDGLQQAMAVDGMNEKGLSIEALYLPGETQYQTIPAGKESQAIPYIHFGDWVLGNFETVAEVKQALSNVYVYEQAIPGLGNAVFPLHFAIYDATGKGITVEFVNGKMNVYENEVGVLTNSPTYEWQVSNLRNYLNLSPYNPNPINLNGLIFSATGQGSGAVGLPGDVSPPSRFVKMAFMLKNVYPAQDASGTVNLAEHIINNVDIPSGIVRGISNGKESYDYTQWVVFKDLTHKVFYFRTYNDLSLRSVSLDKLNFADNAPQLKMPLSQTPTINDVTATFQESK